MDIPVSPAVRSAAEFAESVGPGRLHRTVFSAGDVAPLIGLEGASFVAKLPEGTPPSILPCVAWQWLVGGKALGDVDYGSGFLAGMEEAGPWLIDVGVSDAFPIGPGSPEPKCAIRLRSLSVPGHYAGFFSTRGPMTLPEGVAVADDARFAFSADSTVHEADVEVDQDIAIGCWFQCGSQVQMGKGIMAMAETAAMACVIYVRFQLAGS